MFVTLDDNERIVLRYEVPTKGNGDDYAPSGAEFILIHDIDVTDDYLILHKAPKEPAFRLMWKGNFEVVISKFADEVETWERDHQLELRASYQK